MNSNYCIVGKERYFRSKYNNKFYNCKVRGTGEDWWRYASYSDQEMLDRGAKPDVKRLCDDGWHMCL